MDRKHRIQYEGAIYHVMNRGDRREPIFRDDQDRTVFLATLGACCDRTGWEVHALCLMTRKGHDFKVRLARRLRRETTVTWAWIGDRLRMGGRSNASNLVYALEKSGT